MHGVGSLGGRRGKLLYKYLMCSYRRFWLQTFLLCCRNSEFKSMHDPSSSRGYLDLTSVCICMQGWYKVGRRVLGAVRLRCGLAGRKCGSSPCENVRMLLITMQRVYHNSSDPYCCFLIRMSRFSVITGKDNDTHLTWFVHYTQLYQMSDISWGVGCKDDSSFPAPQELADSLLVYRLL